MRRLLLSLVLVAAACGTSSAVTTSSAAPPVPGTALPPPAPPAGLDVEVVSGIAVTAGTQGVLYRPAAGGPWPLVVLAPGGSWRSADPGSTAGLARDLASRGAVVLNAGYRLSADEAFGDVACALAVARASAGDWDADPGRVVLAGHSAGAHVAAVAALAGPAPSADCAAGGTGAPPDAFVGIAGPYDVTAFAPVPELRRFFGGAPAAVPEAWAAGDPYRHLGSNPAVEIELVHGRTDLAVLPVFSLEFAAALRAAGRDVGLYLVPSANHFDLLDAAENAAETSAVILAAAG